MSTTYTQKIKKTIDIIGNMLSKIPCSRIPLKDKGCHLIAGFIISSIAMIFFGPIFSLIIGAGAGVIKEVIDSIRYDGWDTSDAIYTTAGSVLAVVVFSVVGIIV